MAKTNSRPYRLLAYGFRTRAFKTLGAALKALRALSPSHWVITLEGTPVFDSHLFRKTK